MEPDSRWFQYRACRLVDQRTLAAERFRRHFTYGRLEATSIFHSFVFAGLLVCAFLIGKPQPWTFIFGFVHGVLFAIMCVVCITAARYRVVAPQVAVAVIVFGGVGPFIGTYFFIRYADQREPEAATPDQT